MNRVKKIKPQINLMLKKTVMDIVKITMRGYGCDIAKGIINKKTYDDVDRLVDNVWHKNLFKKLKEKSKIKTYSEDYGIINGSITIEVNDNIILDNDISVIDILGDIKTISKDIEGPKTKGLLLTIVQHQEGIICDTIFVLDDEFDLSKVCFVKKNIRYNLDNPCMSTLYCELYYDGELIPLIDSETDLRTSRLYLEKINNYE
jgi:hypothetical protein